MIQDVDANSHTKLQTVQTQISWLLQKTTGLDLHCLQKQDISGFSRTRVKILSNGTVIINYVKHFLSFSELMSKYNVGLITFLQDLSESEF